MIHHQTYLNYVTIYICSVCSISFNGQLQFFSLSRLLQDVFFLNVAHRKKSILFDVSRPMKSIMRFKSDFDFLHDRGIKH